MEAKLYLVGTPIGNLKDITLRALETLRECDVIAAEDTRQTLKLLNHFNIKKQLISYHKFNEKDKSNYIIELLENGKSIALVTDAGMPGISDPGSVIVERCIEENIAFEVIPGATALITALVYSGQDTTKFLFRGFMPRENKEKTEVINQIKDCRESLIFYEAPHRLVNTLKFLRDSLGNRSISICKELTKMHETINRMKLDEAIEYYNEKSPKGEYVLVVQGKTEEEIKSEEMAKWENITIEEHIKKYMEDGENKKDAIKKVAKDRSLPKKEVYKYSIDI